MLKLMDLRKERTLKLLREAAIELLHEKPFQKITVSEICERAMVRRPTFYRHFQSKEDLLLYAIRMRRDSIQQSLLGDEARTISGVDYALTMTRKFLQIAAEHRHVYRSHNLDESFASTLALAADEIGHEFALFLAEREGLKKPTYNQSFLAALYINGLFGALRFWLTEDSGKTEKDFMTAFTPIVQRLFESY